jgi:ABC-type nitrate/sulfonate/bicarbonate transport system substrate-binding protein
MKQYSFPSILLYLVLKVLAKFDVPTPGGGISTTAALLKQNRKLVLDFLKGYIKGVHYMINQKKREPEGVAKILSEFRRDGNELSL